MVAALQLYMPPASAEETYITSPYAGLWHAAMSSDVLAAAYAAYIFDPLGLPPVVDAIEADGRLFEHPVLGPGRQLHYAGLEEAYIGWAFACRAATTYWELEQIVLNSANPYLPMPIDDLEYLAFGYLEIPWMGISWDEDGYENLREGHKLLANAVGIGLAPGQEMPTTTYDMSKSVTMCSDTLGYALHHAGYPDVAAALAWITGNTYSDIVNYSYDEASESGLQWPTMDDCQGWKEEVELCDKFIDYARLGLDHLESSEELQFCLAYNSLLIHYQLDWEIYYDNEQNHHVRYGFVWPERDRTHAPKPADGLDVLSFWHRS